MTTCPDPAPPGLHRRWRVSRDWAAAVRWRVSAGRRVSRRWRATAVAGLAAAGLSACAVVPDSGPVQAGKIALQAGGQGQDYLQLIPRRPQPGWNPEQIVAGFLAACASFADNHAVARQYLDPAVRNSWNPGGPVTVVGATLVVVPATPLSHLAGAYSEADQVTATGEKLATLTAAGQYVGSQGASGRTFQLYKIHGQWRIENPPSRLLLTEPDFKRVYAPRNLYFLADLSRALVPDPVFVPLQTTYVDLANKLVTALLSSPQGWLESAVSTAFPYRTKLLRQVTLNDGTATVDLGGAAASASSAIINQMTYQLFWTLAEPSYGQSAIQSVNLEINGHPVGAVSLPGQGGRLPGQGGRHGLSVPQAPRRAALYAAAGNGAVVQLTGPPASSRSVPGEAGEGRVRLATIAVSPGGGYVAGLTRSGKAVSYGALRRGAQLAEWKLRGQRFTSLSWDASGNLWVAASGGVWMLRPGARAVPLRLDLPTRSVVSQLRVASDGVRVAMIVHGPAWPAGPRLLLAAIGHRPGGVVALGPAVPTGDDVSYPTQLTWYDADNLVVLSRSSVGPQLHEVPVNGDSSTALITAPQTQTISAAGPDNPLAAGLAGGQLALTSSLNGTWVTRKGAGLSPTYPG